MESKDKGEKFSCLLTIPSRYQDALGILRAAAASSLPLCTTTPGYISSWLSLLLCQLPCSSSFPAQQPRKGGPGTTRQVEA